MKAPGVAYAVASLTCRYRSRSQVLTDEGRAGRNGTASPSNDATPDAVGSVAIGCDLWAVLTLGYRGMRETRGQLDTMDNNLSSINHWIAFICQFA